ncbi:unnamed protein product [Rotaria magnacalcarata]|uniref:Selenoprotein F/M domain-containing protein n=1 Tax=Rotaria magnacalcarata TaxID=392030 RepID=A0A8S2N2Z7_9BILA|nr:unnamed protein product [Rotaria magnacalcarata]CAF4020185.1 unnamed protein product [Rotaria magnacalcarata]
MEFRVNNSRFLSNDYLQFEFTDNTFYETSNVEYVRGADPILNLYNDSDEQVESMGIEKWDTDTLTAFLEENLAH